MNFRRCLFWTHLACGVVAGIVILMMSVTGVLLTAAVASVAEVVDEPTGHWLKPSQNGTLVAHDTT